MCSQIYIPLYQFGDGLTWFRAIVIFLMTFFIGFAGCVFFAVGADRAFHPWLWCHKSSFGRHRRLRQNVRWNSSGWCAVHRYGGMGSWRSMSGDSLISMPILIVLLCWSRWTWWNIIWVHAFQRLFFWLTIAQELDPHRSNLEWPNFRRMRVLCCPFLFPVNFISSACQLLPNWWNRFRCSTSSFISMVVVMFTFRKP